jgi:hypothetical protein
VFLFAASNVTLSPLILFLLAGIAGSGKTALLRTIAYRHALAKNSAPGLPSLPKDDKYAAFRTFARIIVLRLRDVQVRVVVVLPVVMCVYVCVCVCMCVCMCGGGG